MVATSLLNTVVPALWVGGLVLVLVGRAIGSWLRYRDAARYARHAARLADATLAKAEAEPEAIRRLTVVAGRQADEAASRLRMEA